MIVDRHISFIRTIRVMRPTLIALAVLSVTTAVFMKELHFGEFGTGVDLAIPLVLGTAISVFLGFRTNSAYERWWEARKIWGAIVNDTRSIVRLFRDFDATTAGKDLDSSGSQLRAFAYRQAAWCQILAQQLRGHDPLANTDHLLSEEERTAFAARQNPALAALLAQGGTVRAALEAGRFDVWQAICIEEAINRLTDYQGACERIRNTVFPAHYSYFTKVFLWVFLLLLGLSLPVHADVGYFAVPAVFVIGWIFFLIEGIGDYMQDPFADNRNSTPMFTLARMLEIDLKEILGEEEVPLRLQPEEGVLM